ncbi:ubiquitin-protein ligase, PUB12 [Selaginella moellendorffii]|uniref:U-box domain-containing protein 12 n=1 Tax=Selaginella moellendorffii TaxID=88036 RepID=D8R4N0_SELML|nr:ubiquitin-protein ligase, PUB12 [Selaginella moellendorffii]
MAEQRQRGSAEELIKVVNAVAWIGGRTKLYKRECSQLVRRLRLMLPLLEEIRELKHHSLPDDAVTGLLTATLNAKQLVSLCQAGPKLYLVLERETLTKRFLEIARLLAGSLDHLSLEKLDVSDEVCEQVQLLHSQLKRAKICANTLEARLHDDLLSVISGTPEEVDQSALRRLAEGLNLKTSAEVRKESQAFHKVKGENGIDERVKRALQLLSSIQTPDNTAAPEDLSSQMARTDASTLAVIPDDFRCPISLELMKDPVIVATGQVRFHTYERASIQKWLDTGHKTCPKTQQVLPHQVLTSNFVLKSLISQWCESNGVDFPQRMGTSRKSCAAENSSSPERATIDGLVQKLASGQPDLQKAAAGEIRLLAKKSAENRDCIAEAGALRHLVNLLATKDLRTQEHAVTALLNLSINDNNKGPIVMLGAIDPIVEVLKSGSMEARENAAATLFSLSVVDENKITIGASGAIPALVELLRDGSARGKKDAATALFNLSIYQSNKARAVRSGVVPHLMDLLVNQSMAMVDESLTILAILATHPEGRLAIGQSGAVPVLVELIKTGSPRNRENAAALLYALGVNDSSHLVAALELGAAEALAELSQNGTARARRKANALLELSSKHQHQQQHHRCS